MNMISFVFFPSVAEVGLAALSRHRFSIHIVPAGRHADTGTDISRTCGKNAECNKLKKLICISSVVSVFTGCDDD